MDIFEYIDRVKANFDKKPEPRYNMKKYFMGGSVTTPKRGLVDEPGSYGGFKQVTDKEFTELYKEFQSLDNLGTDPEFVDFLNEKKIKPGTLGTSGEPRLSKSKKFTTKTVSGRRQRLNLKTKVKPNVSPKKQAEVARINELIQKEVNIANKGSKYISPADISFKVEDQLDMKPYFIDRINAQGKKIKIRDKRFAPNSYPAFKNLDSMVTKVDNVLKEMLISEEPLNDYFYKELAKRTDLNNTTITKIRNNVPTYKVIADQGADKLLTIKNEPALKNLSLSQQLVEAIEIEKGMPTYIDYGEGKKSVASPRTNIMQFAKRSWNNNKGQGEIKFFDKNRKFIKWERGLKLPYKNVSFLYQGKKYSVNSLTPTLVQKDFPEVKKVTDAANKLRTIQIDDPFDPGKKISVNSLIRKVQVNGYKWKPRLGTINVLHGPEGVKNKPFTNLTYNTRDINQLEAGFTNSLKAGTITETQYKKIVKELYKPFVKGDLDKAIIGRITKQAQQIKKGKFYGFDELKDKQVKTLLASLSRNPKCKAGFFSGGRVGFEDGSVSLDQCAFEGAKVANSGKIRPGAEFRNFAKLGQFFARAGTTAAGVADILLSAGAGAKGLGVGLLLETGFAMEQASKGQPGLGFSQTILGDVYNAVMPDEKEINLENRLLKSAKTEEERVGLQNLIDFNKDQREFAKKAKRFDYLYNAPEFEREGVDLQKLEDELYEMYANLQDRTPKIMNKEISNILADASYRVADEGRDKLKGFYGKIFGDRQLKDKSMDRNVLADSYFTAMAPQVSDVIGMPMFANPEQIQSTQQQLGLPTSYQATPQELDDIYDMGRLGASSGGIASGPPPEKGPQSQGLAYLMKNGKR